MQSPTAAVAAASSSGSVHDIVSVPCGWSLSHGTCSNMMAANCLGVGFRVPSWLRPLRPQMPSLRLVVASLCGGTMGPAGWNEQAGMSGNGWLCRRDGAT